MDEQTARWYVDNYGEHISQALTVKVAAPLPNDIVLDVGCGSGSASRTAADAVCEGKVIGIDPSPAMLRIARELTATHPGRMRIEFLEGSAECIPLDDNSVTLAIAINSVHHWVSLDRGLSEVARVLAPRGRLVISEERLQGGRFGHGEGATADPDHVADAMRAAGFQGVETGTASIESDAILYLLGVRAER
jgi:ubiquinone/menaquinone biosynthesis C-methylase UbiE